MTVECYWDAELTFTRCPKHGVPIGECPAYVDTAGTTVAQALVRKAGSVVPASAAQPVTRDPSSP